MKKLLLVLCGIFIIVGMNVIKTNESDNVDMNDSNIKNEIDVIQSMDDIEQFNNKILNNKSMFDLNSIKSISKEKLLQLINKYSFSSLLTANEKNIIINNLNLNNIPNDIKIQKGVIVQKTNLKAFPTDIIFKSKTYKTFDLNQETELHVNMPILIVHESLDQQFSFVISKIYAGWIHKNDYAIVDSNYLETDKKCIITDKYVEINNIYLDMGVQLPYISSNDEYVLCRLPSRGLTGILEYNVIQIKKEQVSIDYLPFHRELVINQALKYENTPYSWGGKEKDGIDCSGYVSNVLKSFGIQLPRNTGDQELCFDNAIRVSNQSTKEKIEILKDISLGLLYQDGHVMLYLGNIDGQLMMIHANASTMDVYLEDVSNSRNLEKIYLIIPLENGAL